MASQDKQHKQDSNLRNTTSPYKVFALQKVKLGGEFFFI